MIRSMLLVLTLWFSLFDVQADTDRLHPIDVFNLEWASDPQISSDGKSIVFVRNFMDIMSDRRRSNLAMIDIASGDIRPLTSGSANHYAPRWSPDGKRLAWLSNEDSGTQLWMRWMDTGQSARVSNLTESPGGLSWSPDGRWLAMSMPVATRAEPLAKMPSKPDGAEWAEPVTVIDKMVYRADGRGILPDAFQHLFVIPAEGGTPRQVTSGNHHHRGTASWTADSSALIFAANRYQDWQRQPLNSEVFRLDLDTGELTQLTDRYGPDTSPAVSPDGEHIAYIGFDDQHLGYQVRKLYVMAIDGSEKRLISADLDRDVEQFRWDSDGRSLIINYTSEGDGKVARIDLDGDVSVLSDNFGGTAIGRPYGGGSLSVASNDTVAFTATTASYPAEVAITHRRGRGFRRLTRLNDDVFAHKQLGSVEEIWFESSHDAQRIHGWIVKPPGFDPSKKYPLMLEIHGGPFSNYGPRFSPEVQLYAAAGYVVLYTNPRGSTSYGHAFGNAIHHAYPGYDYHDLMSGVDAVVAQGYVDPDQLYITGGSGGGVLTAWSIGHTHRFRAAAVQKPVINWYSFVLTADSYHIYSKYWFATPPWEDPKEYLRRSPISYVSNVTTPTLVITGEADHRTPISESEQYYQALQLLGVPSVMVRLPGASHGIANRPSQMIAKVQNILAWFERYAKSERSSHE
ncbi:MAG: acyl-peptide hydrolase [Lysobacteraceae bacterium]|nr:MAG: acyl-peptide hydrolase [Xanthomonadaceae bacterium]